MSILNQNKTPYLDALKKYLSKDVSPFDVPGHHMGNAENKLKDFLGKKVFEADVNAPIGMDNLAHPTGCIKEACELLADATGADKAFFLINGTTSGILAMIITVCKANDKIILPRNVHKSIINALVISGAQPVYVMPEIDMQLEIANQPSVEDYKKAILKYPSAKAIFVINPTYFGAVNDLKALVKFAHLHGVAVLVDEAHGCHYYFNEYGPCSAMKAGADVSSVSFHKTGGSLTQSSVLLMHEGLIHSEDIQKSLNMINTTSPNSILLASIDAARSYMATKGQAKLLSTIKLCQYARKEIAKIKGFVPCNKDHFLAHGCYDYDETKLVIELDHIDLNGFEVYHLLKEKYGVQMELAETYVLLGIFAIGTKKEHVDHLVNALKEISKIHYHAKMAYPRHHFSMDFPFSLLRPRAAFHAPSKRIDVKDAAFEISKEQIMIYPPGIPLIVPGEVFTPELIAKLENYRKTGVTILSDYGDGTVNVIDQDKWKHYMFFKKKLVDYLNNRLTNPRNDGYAVPFEGEKHKATIILLPFRRDTWRNNGVPARDTFKKVIEAISKHEEVLLGIHPNIYKKVIGDFDSIPNVHCISIKYNDSWARDNSPIFVMNKDGKLRTVDFRFNAWGGDYDGLYSNYKDDDHLASNIAKRMKLSNYYLNDFILEGGSINVDGEGTCLVTEACLLSPGRNPRMSKNEIEEVLKTYLNVEKVIWLKHGIYQDETNEHVDNMACFVRPGEVALAWCQNKSDPQYAYCQSAYKTLTKETDAKGRSLVIHKILLPEPQYMSKNEAKHIGKSRYNAKKRLPDSRLAASYINYYQGDKFIVMPAFGVPQDALAYQEMCSLYPDKEVIQINTREILLGGGNIHCITMQIPRMEKINED